MAENKITVAIKKKKKIEILHDIIVEKNYV